MYLKLTSPNKNNGGKQVSSITYHTHARAHVHPSDGRFYTQHFTDIAKCSKMTLGTTTTKNPHFREN
jgi:hypothetical protein